MRQVDDEVIAALLDGRFVGRERDEVLAYLVQTDEDFQAFSETAVVLREVEAEDAAAFKNPAEMLNALVSACTRLMPVLRERVRAELLVMAGQEQDVAARAVLALLDTEIEFAHAKLPPLADDPRPETMA